MDNLLQALATEIGGSVRLGRVERVDEAGTPWVLLPGGRPVPAVRLAGVTIEQLRTAQTTGAPVVLVFAEGSKAVVLGVVAEGEAPTRVEARVDGKKVVLQGENEVVIRCGKASITLTRAGKVLIKGAYVLSRSSGVNRIKGGSVQIN